MNSKKIFVFLLCFLIVSVFLHAGNVFAIVPVIPCASGDCTVEYSATDATICEIEVKTESQVSNDPSHNYPYGLFEFTLHLPGGLSCAIVESKAKAKDTVRIASAQSATMTLKFYDAAHNEINMEGYTYRKYGLEPVDDLNTPTNETTTPHWYDFMWDEITGTGAQISGNTITLYFVDGQRGDDDITSNGTIVDQGGPGDMGMGIPTMTEWGMIIFTMVAGLGAVYYLRRQKTATS